MQRVSLLPFIENQKKCPDFGKNGPDYVHPDVNNNDEFVSVNDVLREYNEMNEKIKNL